MSDNNLLPGSPPGSLTTQEACKRLGYESRQAFHKSLSDRLARWEPFGPRYPLWDEREVSEWEEYLQHRRQKIEAGEWPPNHPLPTNPPPLDWYE